MKNIIIERLNCNVKTAEKLETKLNVISDELKPILNAWLESGLKPATLNIMVTPLTH